MKALMGIKIGMTQVFEDNGIVVPVTVIQAGPCYVTQVKSENSEGYLAIQLGFGEVKAKRLTMGEQGHLGLLKTDKKHPRRRKGAGVPPLRHLREFRTQSAADYHHGQVLTVEQFTPGDVVDVSGKSKGRGFAGGVKRHGFSGGPKTHGQSDRWRAPGSIGANTGIARVIKGKHMAGHMGDVHRTVQNLQVVRIDPERNLIAIKGAIPGSKGGLVIIRDAAKG